MRKFFLLSFQLLALGVVLTGCQGPPSGFTADANDLWKDGRGLQSARWPMPQPLLKADLSNAEFQPGSWAWNDDVLMAKGLTPWAGGVADLWTKETYGNFALSVEFRCAKAVNSGILLRCGDIRNWLQTSIEVQILQGDDPEDTHLMGAIYDCQAPDRQVSFKAGEWQRLTIVAKANNLTVTFNGEDITKMNLDEWTEPHQNPDGSKNKFNTAYKDMPRAGQIGLQYHGGQIEFRNLLIERL